MTDFQKILDSFSIRDSLNPKVWDNPNDPKEAKLKSKIQKGLIKIAEEFVDYLGDDVFVEDIILTGSLANYNWSEFSDFDLHVIIDFSDYGKQKDLYKELFDLKKAVFNDKHDIKVVNYDVELYAQDVSESHFSTGTYSIMNEKWETVPQKKKTQIDKNLLKKKIDSWTKKIDLAIESDGREMLEKIKTKLKDYRKSGLEKEGEYAYENLVFKFLRRSGHVEKLFDNLNKSIDKELSVERQINEEIEKDPLDIIKSSKFLSSLMNYVDDQINLEYKLSEEKESEIVKLIQEGLQLLGFHLPKWGIDGIFGTETKQATMDFQRDIGLTPTGSFGLKDLKYLIGTLVLKKFKDSDLSKIKYEKENSGLFTYLDLDTEDGYKKYKEICQNFISGRNPSAGVTGEMMADCARENFSKGYVPPELALAQLAAEGGLSFDSNAKPIRTNNPFNVKNTPTTTTYVPTKKEGVCRYYDLMTRKYLVGGKKADDLLDNFVNINGHRYAGETGYESAIKSIVTKIANKIS
jgi:peptidoglycan hydrolase-like protein with peptidoglycan-binding domain